MYRDILIELEHFLQSRKLIANKTRKVPPHFWYMLRNRGFPIFSHSLQLHNPIYFFWNTDSIENWMIRRSKDAPSRLKRSATAVKKKSWESGWNRIKNSTRYDNGIDAWLIYLFKLITFNPLGHLTGASSLQIFMFVAVSERYLKMTRHVGRMKCRNAIR